MSVGYQSEDNYGENTPIYGGIEALLTVSRSGYTTWLLADDC